MHDELEHVLDEIEYYLEDREDIRDGGDGAQLPNREMTLLMDIRMVRQQLKAMRPEARLTDEQIMSAACNAADALDATRVSELRAGKWHATTIFDGDTGLLRFGRLVEELTRGPQGEKP